LTDDPCRVLLHHEYVQRRRVGPRLSAPIEELWFLFNDQIIRAKAMGPNGPLRWKESARLSVQVQLFSICENSNIELSNAIAISIPGRSEELCCELPSPESKAQWLQHLQECTGQKPRRRSRFFTSVDILELGTIGTGTLPSYRSMRNGGYSSPSPTNSERPRPKDRGSYDGNVESLVKWKTRPLSG